MGLLSVFLALSARVVDQYYDAYKAMDSALPSSRGLAHQLEFLTRELSCADTIRCPSQLLRCGFRPGWQKDATLLEYDSRDADGRRVRASLGYSPTSQALLLVRNCDAASGGIDSSELSLGRSGGLWIQQTDVARQPLLTLRLDPPSATGEPLQTALSLKAVVLFP
jgi:hypothetical protein